MKIHISRPDPHIHEDGIGDLAQFNSFSRNAGIAFYTAGAMWVMAIVLSLTKRQFRSKAAQVAIGLPPIAIVLGVLFPWLI